jgi:2-methylcitrate dehydratase PrpD
MASAHNRALPDLVIEAAKLHILDTFAAMISGSQLLPGRKAIDFARSYGGNSIATVAASDIRCGPIEAALTNGMLAHSDETDDSDAPSQSHPGCAVVPAALALAEQYGTDGPHFIRAVVLGYDIGTRFTMMLGGGQFQTETHRSTHSIAGLFGAAAAAASIAHLTPQQMRWLLDYAAQEASGIAAWERDTDHIEKAFVFAGKPASQGVTAALLVAAGWNGVDDILSGADSFVSTCAPRANVALLIEELGERYEVTRTNVKKWTVGSPIQAPLDALELIMRKHHLTSQQVTALDVRLATPEAVIVNNRALPDICLQHMLAVMLLDGTVTFRSAHDKDRMHDPAVLKERAKVQVTPDERLTLRLPRREAIVEVTLADGQHFTQHVEAVRGTAENPMSTEEVSAKVRDLITPVIGKAACDQLLERVLHMENIVCVRELHPFLAKG